MIIDLNVYIIRAQKVKEVTRRYICQSNEILQIEEMTHLDPIIDKINRKIEMCSKVRKSQAKK